MIFGFLELFFELLALFFGFFAIFFYADAGLDKHEDAEGKHGGNKDKDNRYDDFAYFAGCNEAILDFVENLELDVFGLKHDFWIDDIVIVFNGKSTATARADDVFLANLKFEIGVAIWAFLFKNFHGF